MATMTLKPGLLVSLATRIEGGVQYQRVDLEPDKAVPSGAAVARWETTKVTEDPEEHARAVKVRGKARSLISGACTHSAFGLLCLTSNESKLDEAIAEAGALVEAYNTTATATHVSLYTLRGRIAESEGEAARAIASELRGMIDDMKTGIEEADVEKIRAAASSAKKMGAMLDESTGRKVQAAVEEARSAARAIVKRVIEGGESAGLVVQELNRRALEEARFAFLDLDEPTATVAPAQAAPRALDIHDDEDTDEGAGGGEGEGGMNGAMAAAGG